MNARIGELSSQMNQMRESILGMQALVEEGFNTVFSNQRVLSRRIQQLGAGFGSFKNRNPVFKTTYSWRSTHTKVTI